MALNSDKKELPTGDELFKIILRHKDTNPSNLNKLFASYGCDTLEAKCPVVSDPVANQLMEGDRELKIFGTLALKSESASKALEGRNPRTRDRELKLVEINGETMLSAGGIRERSPVDPKKLDDDLEEYMETRARLKANKMITDQ